MPEKNQLYEAEICDYTADGQGIARVEGCAVFLPNAVAGERCRIRIERLGKTWSGHPIGSIGNVPWRSCAAAVIFGI